MIRARAALALSLALLAIGCRRRPSGAPTPRDAVRAAIVPEPASLVLSRSEPFTVTEATRIIVETASPEVARTADMLAGLLRPSTGFVVPVSPAADTSTRASAIVLRLVSDRESLGLEGYELTVTRDSVRIVASQPAGIFNGVQTLRQLLPADVESHMKLSSVRWTVPAVTIVDRPRFAWRGAMLDVSRHFFTVREVKQYVDLLALYKLNVLHLHLSDDQGWRIEIKSRPQLATMGGRTQVGGGPGGFYTQDEYAEIVRYAQERYVTIVPEIDMPAHSNAALVSHPELSCSRHAPALYTGTEVGWSALCPDKEGTYALIDDVVREIAALTPGAYFHIGGDEVEMLSKEAYVGFVERVQDIVVKHGKRMIGWEEIAQAKLSPATLVQQWRGDTMSLTSGGKLIMSPGKRLYLDMKYTASTELGLQWAGLIEVRDVYDWDPATYNPGVSESGIMGIEAPLWSETLRNITAVEYLAMPRLPAVAELAWTPQAARSWNSFRVRLAAQAPRWNLLGVNYYRSPQIPW